MIDLFGNMITALALGALAYVLGYAGIIAWIMWLHS
jgi:hypothetical protein